MDFGGADLLAGLAPWTPLHRNLASQTRAPSSGWRSWQASCSRDSRDVLCGESYEDVDMQWGPVNLLRDIGVLASPSIEACVWLKVDAGSARWN